MELIIVRHGRPVRQEVPEGESADPDLSDLGRLQAKATAEYLASEDVDHIASSSMLRATSTAAPLAEQLAKPVETFDDLRESDHRSNFYVPVEEMERDDPALAHYTRENIHDSVFPQGYDEFRQRVVRGFEQIIGANRSKKVAVFCHAMVTSVYLQTVLDMVDPFKITVDYCGISRVMASSTGKRSVRSVNETHHVRDLLER